MIKMVLALFEKYRELVIYCLIGCTGATLDFVVYAGMTHFTAIHYQMVNFVSVSLGIVNNFFLNRHFNFSVKDRVGIRLASFYVVGMFGWTMSAVFLWFLVEHLMLSELIAKLGTIVLVTVVQFCLNKVITFKKGSGKVPSDEQK